MTLGAGQSIPPDYKQLHQMLLEQRNSRPTYQRIYDDIPDDVIIETDSGNRQPAATQRENSVVTRPRLLCHISLITDHVHYSHIRIVLLAHIAVTYRHTLIMSKALVLWVHTQETSVMPVVTSVD